MRNDASFWTCPTCTLLNNRDAKECIVCDTAFVRPSTADVSKKGDMLANLIECPLCTFLNIVGSRSCQMCTSDLEKEEDEKNMHDVSSVIPVDKSVQYIDSDSDNNSIADSTRSNDSEVSSSYYYDAAAELFAVLTEAIIDTPQTAGAATSSFKCKADGRVCRTRGIMTAYLVKQHKDKLDTRAFELQKKERKMKRCFADESHSITMPLSMMAQSNGSIVPTLIRDSGTSSRDSHNSKLNYTSNSSSGSISSSRSISNHAALTDGEIALQMALQDYEDVIDQPQQIRKRKQSGSDSLASHCNVSSSSSSSSSSSEYKKRDQFIQHSNPNFKSNTSYPVKKKIISRTADSLLLINDITKKTLQPAKELKTKTRRKNGFSETEDEESDENDVNTDDEEGVTEREEAAYRQRRLQKLLSRTDKIVSKLNFMMSSVCRQNNEKECCAKPGKKSQNEKENDNKNLKKEDHLCLHEEKKDLDRNSTNVQETAIGSNNQIQTQNENQNGNQNQIEDQNVSELDMRHEQELSSARIPFNPLI